MRPLTLLLIITLAVLTSGCTAKRAWPEPQSKLPHPPDNWTASVSTPAAETEPRAWLDSFADPQLAALIAEALQRNLNLQLLAARVKAAQARAGIVGAALRPQADLQFSATRRQTGADGSTAISNNFALQGALSWEIDLWNRLGSAKQAAGTDISAAQADQQAAQLALVATVARNWFRLNEALRQLQLAIATEDSYRQSLQVIEQQYRSGLNSALDLRLARAALANATSSSSERRLQLDLQRRELETLLGRYPSGQLEASGQLPQLALAVPVGLPSTLLQRRPDLQAAARRLTASSQRAAAAELNRLPVFNLTSAAGTASDQLHQLLDWDYLLWSLAGSVLQPLFDGDRRSAEQQLAISQEEELLTDYAISALNAFREVESALAAENSLQLQQSALQTAVTEASEAQALAEQRYRQGLEGIITLLETQRRAYSAQIALLTSSRQRLENRINLHLALGGPFADPPASLTAEDSP